MDGGEDIVSLSLNVYVVRLLVTDLFTVINAKQQQTNKNQH